MKNEATYYDIITELESGRTQVVKDDETYKRMNGILAVYSHHQDAKLDFWRIIVPSDASTKERIIVAPPSSDAGAQDFKHKKRGGDKQSPSKILHYHYKINQKPLATFPRRGPITIQ